MNIRRFFRLVYHDRSIRRDQRRIPWRDVWLYARNRALQPLERRLVRRHRRDDVPVVFLVGAPRAGTTLLFQLIVRGLDVGYVNNYMARYWMAPVVGARSWRRRGGGPPDGPLASEYGRTSGDAEPHEFSWFWQFHTGLGERNDLGDEAEAWPWHDLRAELQGLAGFFGKPLVLKSLNATTYQAEWLHRRLPDARFVWIRRQPVFNAQSILKVRRERYGDERLWWSVRPADAEQWFDREPFDQVAHQLADIHRALEAARERLPAEAFHCLEYEDLVRDPDAELERLSRFLGAARRDAVLPPLHDANVPTLGADRLVALEAALEGSHGR